MISKSQMISAEEIETVETSKNIKKFIVNVR